MIYKFKFEIWEEDNQILVHAFTEESGDLILVFKVFFGKMLGYFQMKNLW